MKRALIALVAVLAVPALAQAQGTTTEIATGDNFFEPEDIAGDVGVESYHWQWATENPHNVVEAEGLFDSGKIETTGELTITPSAGTFPYICEIHGFLDSDGDPIGMGGTITVRPTATPQGKRALVTWATEATDTGNRYDVRRKIGSKKAKIVEEKTKAIEGAFKIKPGKKYKFQVRSRQGKATSEWSPKLKLKG